MLKTTNLSKHFGGIKAVDNVNIEIRPAKITAIIGPNGSGKSTLFNLISGLIKRDKGEVFLNKDKISKLKDFEISDKGLSEHSRMLGFSRI